MTSLNEEIQNKPLHRRTVSTSGSGSRCLLAVVVPLLVVEDVEFAPLLLVEEDDLDLEEGCCGFILLFLDLALS